jgi:hypothetical protein
MPWIERIAAAAVAVAALIVSSVGSPSASAATAPAQAFDAHGFPVGYACFDDGQARWSCFAPATRAPPAMRCYFDGKAYHCYKPAARVTGHVRGPAYCLRAKDGAEVGFDYHGPVDSYICRDTPPSSPPPPKQQPVVIPPR